ncbi:hypothetical protein B0H63DRAFT_498275 [Podospora didyma]|uniref:Polynucleotide 5'-hydroxyl-kinase GRC3 n=1 Tax=Podospora didyma TaxID=330526 RepID=A0AAE0N0W9_9PEZI|nr:hypothetical protein B0H63DRAFT_498275 [Podospora didyma]
MSDFGWFAVRLFLSPTLTGKCRSVLSAFAARQGPWGAFPGREDIEKADLETSAQQREAAEATSAKTALDRKGRGKGNGNSKRQATYSQVPQTLDARPIQTQRRETGTSVPSTPVLTPMFTQKWASIHYSSFKPTKQNCQRRKDGCVLLTVPEGERLVILGSYGIRILEGEATIAGAFLMASSSVHMVHAPHCHAIPVLRTTKDSSIMLHPHPTAQGLRQLARLNPVFGKLWNEAPHKAGKPIPTYQIIFTSDDGPKRAFLQDLISPAEWNKKLAGLMAAKQKALPIVFLCGPKSSGKSTFGRLLANRLVTGHGGESRKRPLSTVVILDLDPGQPESGQLRAHAIASVSPSVDPAHFVECALDLFSHYQRSAETNKHPLVINTPGWVQGTGLDILVELVRHICPTEVIYMSQDGPEETVEGLKSVCRSSGENIPFHTLPSQSSEGPSSRTSLHLRTMQTMSYFHLNNSKPHPSEQDQAPLPAWNPAPLTELRPWRVRYKGAERGLVGVLCYDHQPAPELLLDAINGLVLALVHVEHKAAYRDLINTATTEYTSTESSTERVQGVVPAIVSAAAGIPLITNPHGRTLDPRYSRALSLVLVRGIDAYRGELQLLTPLPSTELLRTSGKNLVLVAGKFDTPSWAYSEDLHARAFGSSAAVAAPAPGQGVDGEDDESDTSSEEEDDEENEQQQDNKARSLGSHTEFPWVEMLHGSQKRSVGSRVWRVRRDPRS